MSIAAGTRIGPYEVVAPLGQGGMGEVYRARDSRLGRDVAMKLLPDVFASDADRLARFEREAQVLAALNHAHIAAIYGIEESAERRALVLELVEGPTLAERMAAGPVALEEALTIARQIAEALEAAHERGIIHRDLKPANVKLTRDGKAKVLDFGLAAITTSAASGIDVSHSPTLTLAATRAGIILGTAGYMAPEQAAGKEVDKRTDVWSFGVVLWELLTGRRLFEGETVSHTLADVLRAPIDFASLPAGTPPFVRELLGRCLERDPSLRLRDIGEARIAIHRYLSNPASTLAAPEQPPPIQPRRRLWLPWAIAGAAVIAAAFLAVPRLREQPSPAAIRFQLLPPAETAFTNGGVVSPDGRMIAFDAPGKDGRPMLWVRALDSLESRPLEGTEYAAAGPFWSPDSRSLGFGTNNLPRLLKRVDVAGGTPQTLAELSGAFREGSWNDAGDILYGDSRIGILRIRASGGAPVRVTALDASRGDVQHANAAFLPDGRRFLYYRAGSAAEHRGVFIGSIEIPPDQQSRDRLLAAESGGVYVQTAGGAFILFLRGGSLLAQAFDGSSMTGDPVQLASDVGNIGSYGWYSAARTGVLVYRTGRGSGEGSEFVWLDRQGRRIGQLGPPADYVNGLQLSADGRKVVTARPEGSVVGPVTTVPGNRMWTADVARGVFGRLTSQEAGENSPAFTPDGRIVFTSTLNGAVGDLYVVPSSGVGAPEPLLLKSSTVKHANDISADGKYLVYDDHSLTQLQDLYVLPLDGSSGERKPIPFLTTAADETFGQFSPDGRWLAYATNESGGRWEVAVQGFDPTRVPAAAVGKWIVSTAGGDKPRWSADGRELYYIAADRKMMAVPIKTGATFEPGVPVPLFNMPAVNAFFAYDVAPNGRFLVNAVRDAATARATPLTVVLNWQAALRR